MLVTLRPASREGVLRTLREIESAALNANSHSGNSRIDRLQPPGFLLGMGDTDPFRELDRLTQQVLGTAARPAAMPMDAWRHGDSFYICLDLPGVDASSIDLTVEQNVLTVRAERTPVKADGAQMIVAERPYGTFTRQVFLGETLDADHITADYAAGVLTLTIPVHEAAKPRSIQVTSSDTKQAVTA